LDAQDLLDGARPPRPRLHRRVVGHDRDRTAVDAPHAGDDAVGGEVGRLAVGEEPVLGEFAPRVEQELEPPPAEQLALLGVLLVVLLGTPGARLLGARGELGRRVFVAHLSSPRSRGLGAPGRSAAPRSRVATLLARARSDIISPGSGAGASRRTRAAP